MNDGGIRGETVPADASPPVRGCAKLGYVPALDGLRGVAVLLVSCLGCSDCPSRDKDDIFNRHDL